VRPGVHPHGQRPYEGMAASLGRAEDPRCQRGVYQNATHLLECELVGDCWISSQSMSKSNQGTRNGIQAVIRTKVKE